MITQSMSLAKNHKPGTGSNQTQTGNHPPRHGELLLSTRQIYPMTDSQLSLVSLASDSELRSGQKSKNILGKSGDIKDIITEILNKKVWYFTIFQGTQIPLVLSVVYLAILLEASSSKIFCSMVYRLIIKTFVAVAQSLSQVWPLAIAWTAAQQAPLPSTISWSLLRFMSIESVMLPDLLFT